MSFEQKIQQWVAIDNQLKTLTDKVKELREKRNELHDSITEETDVGSTIQISDGKLKFVQLKETQPLTFKYLETCLREIIKNEEQVTKILDYIKNKREVKYVSDIKRFYTV
jgi:hypothetical protein